MMKKRPLHLKSKHSKKKWWGRTRLNQVRSRTLQHLKPRKPTSWLSKNKCLCRWWKCMKEVNLTMNRSIRWTFFNSKFRWPMLHLRSAPHARRNGQRQPNQYTIPSSPSEKHAERSESSLMMKASLLPTFVEQKLSRTWMRKGKVMKKHLDLSSRAI